MANPNQYAMVDKPDFNPDGTIYDDHGQVVPATVAVLYDNLRKALLNVYPSFEDFWKIRIDTRGGIVQIWNLAISGEYGIILHIKDIDPEMKKVRELAGELLERFNVARGRALSIKKAMQDVERDSIGRLKHED
jgi:hypothetical protein